MLKADNKSILNQVLSFKKAGVYLLFLGDTAALSPALQDKILHCVMVLNML